jgi:hypothetical protein
MTQDTPALPPKTISADGVHVAKPSMTMKETLNLKDIVEHEIVLLLEDFTVRTGMVIIALAIDDYGTENIETAYRVRILSLRSR